MTKERVIDVAGVIVGAAYVLVSSHVTWMREPISRLLLFAFPVVVPVVVVFSALSERRIVWTVGSLSIGVIGGVLIDVAMDPKPRNLFPVEVIAWCVVLAPAVALGTIGAYFLRRSRTKARQQ